MNTIPHPSEEAREHSERLINLLSEKMKAGSISFADYMQHCLYEPGLGYYVAGSQKFGEAGDFVTAPMISPLFAATLAQCILERFDGDIAILELGAGHGKLANDLLEAFAAVGRPCQYAILEVSPECQAKQREVLSAYASQVTWLSTLPKQFKGVILANEVLDAMPVHLFHYQQGVLLERRVAYQNERFVWQDEPLQDEWLKRTVEALPLTSEDKQEYLSEVNLTLSVFTRSLIEVLEQGMILLIDYGFVREEYYHPARNMGTLMCHYRHFAHPDPFMYPGLQDITAHVDFSVVGETAQRAGCEVSLYSQAEFLIENGLLEIMGQYLLDQDDQAALECSQQVQKLIQPHEMGELFKVMLIEK